MVTAALALVSAAVGLVFDLRPQLRPDPLTTLQAGVSVFAVERGVQQDDGLRRTARSRREYLEQRTKALAEAFIGLSPSPEQVRRQLRVEGLLFYVRVRAQGFKRRAVRLRWSMYQARPERRLAAEGLADVPGASVVGEAPTDESVVPVWTPAVAIEGRCFARFELIDPDGDVLAVADSPRFPGLGS